MFSVAVLGRVGEGCPQAARCFVNGPNFAGHGIPFGIIFGGTDLNEDVNQGEKHQVMGKVLGEARYSRTAFRGVKDLTLWVGFRETTRPGRPRDWQVYILPYKANFFLSFHFIFLPFGTFLLCQE